MQLRPRHIFFLVGSFMIICSFLFFIWQHRVYETLILSGLVVALLSMCLILFYDTTRLKMAWLAATCLLILVQRFSESPLISVSRKIIIHRNQPLLNEVTSILISKPGDVLLFAGDPPDTSMFSPSEREKLAELLLNRGILMVRKDSATINYIVWGRIDIHLGFQCDFTKVTAGGKPGTSIYHLNWK